MRKIEGMEKDGSMEKLPKKEQAALRKAGEPDGTVYQMLEEWLHNPAAATADADVIAALAPYTVPPPEAKEE